MQHEVGPVRRRPAPSARLVPPSARAAARAAQSAARAAGRSQAWRGVRSRPTGPPRRPRSVATCLQQELLQEALPLEVQHALSRMLDEEVRMAVPAHRVGRVIGARGAVIQGLRQETGAQIELQKDAATGAATVALRGSAEAMRAAKLAIERIIESGPL